VPSEGPAPGVNAKIIEMKHLDLEKIKQRNLDSSLKGVKQFDISRVSPQAAASFNDSASLAAHTTSTFEF